MLDQELSKEPNNNSSAESDGSSSAPDKSSHKKSGKPIAKESDNQQHDSANSSEGNDDKNEDSTKANSKSSLPWAIVILLLIFFFPIGLILLAIKIANENNIKFSNMPPEKKKKLLIAAGIILAVSLPIGGIVALVTHFQTEADIAAHSLTINDIEDGEITADCNLIEGTKKCEAIQVSGTYTNGQKHYVPIADDANAEVNLKGSNGFSLTYTPTIDSSTPSVKEKSIKICFSEYSSSHYCPYDTKYPTYNLIVRVNVSDEDRQKVKVIEEKEAEEERIRQEEAEKAKAEEEARKAEEEKAKEEEAKKAAEEEEARKAEEAKKAETSNNNSSSSSNSGSDNSSRSSSSDSDSSKNYILKTISEGESCPSNAKFCNISGKSEGYPSYGYGYMRGKIINNSGRSYRYFQVTADIYNSSGSKIGTCWGNIAGLAAGETWEYEAYCDAWAKDVSLKISDVSGW